MICGFILPLLFGLLAFRFIRQRIDGLDLREAWLYAATMTGVFIVATTEVLSGFHGVTALAVALSWTAGCGALLLLSRSTNRPGKQAQPFGFRSFFSHGDSLSGILLISILIIAGLTAVVAFVGVPNPTIR